MTNDIISDPGYDSIINTIDSLIYISDSIYIDSVFINNILDNSDALTSSYSAEMGDSTMVTVYFPYDSIPPYNIDGIQNTEYQYPILFVGRSPFLPGGGQCERFYRDTITVYPFPVDISISDSIGCPPFLVEFERSVYIY